MFVAGFVFIPVCYVYHEHQHLDRPHPQPDMASCITSPHPLGLQPGLATEAVLLPSLWMTN